MAVGAHLYPTARECTALLRAVETDRNLLRLKLAAGCNVDTARDLVTQHDAAQAVVTKVRESQSAHQDAITAGRKR